jgi:hypothetical protein
VPVVAHTAHQLIDRDPIQQRLKDAQGLLSA